MKVTTINYRKNIGWSKPLPEADSPQTLVLIFGASIFTNFTDPFAELKAKYPNSVIAGCSTAGEIFDDLVLDHSLVVSITQFKHTHIRFFATPISQMEDSLRTGKDIANHLSSDDLSAVLVLTDGLLVNGTDFVNAEEIGQLDDNGEAKNVSLDDGDIVTLAKRPVPAPGGVLGSLEMWIKADKNIKTDESNGVTSWKDNSYKSHELTLDPKADANPLLEKNMRNFNPTVKFDEKKFLVGTVDKSYVSLRISKTLIESKGKGLKEITKRGRGQGIRAALG